MLHTRRVGAYRIVRVRGLLALDVQKVGDSSEAAGAALGAGDRRGDGFRSGCADVD